MGDVSYRVATQTELTDNGVRHETPAVASLVLAWR